MNNLKLVFLLSLASNVASNPLLGNKNYNDNGYNQLKEGHFLDINVLNKVKDIILQHEQHESKILNSYMLSNQESNGYNFIPSNNIVDIQFASVNPSLQLTQFRQQNMERNNQLTPYKNERIANFQPASVQIPSSVLPIESKLTRLEPVDSYGKLLGPLKLSETNFNENQFRNSPVIKSSLNEPIVVDDEDHVAQFASNLYRYTSPLVPSANARQAEGQNVQVLQSESYQMPTTSVEIKEYYTFSQSPAIEILTKKIENEDKKEELKNLESSKDKNDDNDSLNSDIHYIITPLKKKTF